MHTVLEDIDLLIMPAPEDPEAVYDRVADRYEQFRALWVRLAGNAVERPMLAEIETILRPGQRVLDAGCGTGTLARRIHAMDPNVDLTLLDLSSGMLAHTADIPATRVEGNVLDLPFPDRSFDIVVSSWVIETVPDPLKAVSEYLRVIKDGGHVLFTTDPPAFRWHGSIRLLPLISLSGTDILRDGQGQFRIALLDRIPLVDDRGPEIAQADLLRYLAEIVWFPTAWLSDAIAWEGIDNWSARATLRYCDQSVAAVMHFEASDELTRVEAERPRKEGKRNVLTPWGGRNSAYWEMHGMLIPTQCEVAWRPASGEFSYFRAEVTAIAYNEPSVW